MEETNIENEEIHDSLEETNESYFIVHNIKYELCKNMDKLKKYDFTFLPIECLLNQYILRNDNNTCYYVALDDVESGDSFEIYEFEYTGSEETEFRIMHSNFGGKEYLKFLIEKIQDSYNIFIPKK